MARSARGDQVAFAELYDVTSRRVHGVVLRVLRSGRLTPGRLAAASLFYVAFAVALVVALA